MEREFLETRCFGWLWVHPSDTSRVSMWSPTLGLDVVEDGLNPTFPLKVTAPDIRVTVRARPAD
jgi:hypothetical protein